MGVNASVLDKIAARLNAAERAMADDEAMRADLHVAAQPVADTAKSLIRRRSGKTADDIAVRDEEAPPGTVKVSVGASYKKGGRGFISRFLEDGTRKMAASPWLHPAWEQHQAEVKQTLGSLIRKRLFGSLR